MQRYTTIQNANNKVTRVGDNKRVWQFPVECVAASVAVLEREFPLETADEARDACHRVELE